MRVAVVDYGSGNLQSVMQSLRAAGQNAGFSHEFTLTDKPDDVSKADYLVLPGVGAFSDCAKNLHAVDGMIDALTEQVQKRGVPFLGICVGMQLLADVGHEDGRTDGLGWISGAVNKFTPAPQTGRPLKIPHMGWNGISFAGQSHPVLDGIDEGSAVYFVHGYHVEVIDQQHVLARADYGGPVVAAIGCDNIFGVQFHPEKSQDIGQRLLTNWLAWAP